MKTVSSILSNLKFQFQHPMAKNPLLIGLMGILISCKMLKRNNLHVCTCIYPLKCMAYMTTFETSKKGDLPIYQIWKKGAYLFRD